MSKNLNCLEDNLIKKFNLKEARITLTPCDALTPQPVNDQTDIECPQSGSDEFVYMTSECINNDFVNIFYQSQEGNDTEQANGLNLLIASELLNVEGTLIVQQGECFPSDCIILPVGNDQNIQMLRNGELIPDLAGKMIAKIESTSNSNNSGFLFSSDPGNNVSLMSEGTLENDVMLGQTAVGTSRGTDDDDLVGELRKFLPTRNDSSSDIVNDISEYAVDWHGELEWNLEQTSMNEGLQTRHMSEADKLNEEFSRRMREEFAASFIKKNSLMELKKKIGNVKCPGKTKSEEEKILEERKDFNEEANVTSVRSNKRRTFSGSESLHKKLKKETSVDNKVPLCKRKDEEADKSKMGRAEVEARNNCDDIEKSKRRPKKNLKTPADEWCRGLKCKESPRPGSVYCSDKCLESHVQHSVLLLHGHNVENLTERVVVLDRKSGKLITGPLAPTVGNLSAWIQKHPSFEVLQPKLVPHTQSSKKSIITEGSLSIKSSKNFQTGKNYSLPSKGIQKSEGGCQKSGIDSQRINIRKHIQQILLSKMTDSVMMTTLEVKHLAIDLENAIFRHHKSVDKFYNRHCRGLLRLIRQESNEILNGEKSLDDFVKRALLEDGDILSMEGSTSKHDQHFYDINCRICNPFIVTNNKQSKQSLEDKHILPVNKVLSPDVTSTTDLEFCSIDSLQGSKTKAECIKTSQESLPSSIYRDLDHKPSSSCRSLRDKAPNTLIDRVWSGRLFMKDLVNFCLSAFRTSGSMKHIRKHFPATLSILGRISKKVVENYVRTIKLTCSSTKEVGVICFACDDHDISQEGYKTFFHYLHSRDRCGVIGPVGLTIKDVYVWPLLSSHDIPSFLTPFIGPGLDVNRGDLLLGIVVQQGPNLAYVPPITTQAIKLKASVNGEDADYNSNDDNNDIDEDQNRKEQDIIAGNSLRIESHIKDAKKETLDTGSLGVSSSKIEKSIKYEGDKPYDPIEIFPLEKLPSQVLHGESETIHRKFDALLNLLNRKPYLSSEKVEKSISCDASTFSAAHLIQCHLQSSASSQKTCDQAITFSKTSQCEAATAALASLNVFLEKYVAQKKQSVKPDIPINNQASFKLCEITNEQHQLMKQVLEMVREKDSSKGQDCNQAVNEGNAYVLHDKYSQEETLTIQNVGHFKEIGATQPWKTISNFQLTPGSANSGNHSTSSRNVHQSQNSNSASQENHYQEGNFHSDRICMEASFATTNDYRSVSYLNGFRQCNDFYHFKNYKSPPSRNNFGTWKGSGR